jgi:hypothetical protein
MRCTACPLHVLRAAGTYADFLNRQTQPLVNWEGRSF